TSHWLMNAKKANASVINLSAHQDYDSIGCQKSNLFQGVTKSMQQGLFWVLASGNNSAYVDSPKRISMCPQSAVAGNEQALIAGAGHTSNSGKNFTDIFVKNSSDQSVKTSSEASIILADFVLTLKNEFPLLYNKD